MSEKEKRRWVRAWWADQMRNGTVPDVPEEFEGDDFFAIWISEGCRLANHITKRDKPP